MNSLRSVTRRAVPAAFLLFAAVLLVVSPAEGSPTRTDARSSLAPSSSRELAPLELPSLAALDLAAPADASPRFGFAADLSLLDVEARPSGFVVFAAEAAQCELTYARNNPLKYVDPDGRLAETVFDVGMAAISIKQAISSPTAWNIAGAALDVGAVLTPFVPAVGGRVIDAVQAGDKLMDAKRAGSVALDTNALIARLEGAPQDVQAVVKAIGGRNTNVSMTAVKEFLRGGGDVGGLRTFLQSTGGSVGKAPSKELIEKLTAAGLKPADARVVGSAIEQGIPLLTRDKQVLRKVPTVAEPF